MVNQMCYKHTLFSLYLYFHWAPYCKFRIIYCNSNRKLIKINILFMYPWPCFSNLKILKLFYCFLSVFYLIILFFGNLLLSPLCNPFSRYPPLPSPQHTQKKTKFNPIYILYFLSCSFHKLIVFFDYGFERKKKCL